MISFLNGIVCRFERNKRREAIKDEDGTAAVSRGTQGEAWRKEQQGTITSTSKMCLYLSLVFCVHLSIFFFFFLCV